MSLVLGVDSGGTKTLAALADRSGCVVSLIRCPSLDPSANDRWQASLAELVGRMPQLAAVSAAALGLPFHGEIDAYSTEQVRVARALLPVEPVVDNDVRIAFDGAFAGESGALILSGTGSMAWASLNGANDPQIRVGGWGDAFGDEGSAFWVGRESLACISRELDGRSSETSFSAEFLRRLDLRPTELMAWCYALQNRRREFAGLATVTAELAETGDPTARRIMHKAADALAETLLVAWRLAAGDRPLRWSFAGGMTTSSVVMQRIRERVGCEPTARRLPPIGGALYRAAVHARWEVTPAWLECVNASLHEFPAYVEQRNQEARN
ncbi:MAG TPA: BadF/BadG/BcrA/BcrD ATPase family protein [Pararhizobium sp.]|nr:BadF/BadG/BcrA/BcrD ATPase family protein [Pararhizobium sp.]